jgi:eukaryotic-like serine/threonine-protein kinase
MVNVTAIIVLVGKLPEVELTGLPGLETLPTISMESYWIDRYGVTNTEFKRFVDQRGYQRPEFWKHEFKRDGHLLSWWLDAMTLFRDSTGKPGPATWSDGKYPKGQALAPKVDVSAEPIPRVTHSYHFPLTLHARVA